MSFALGFVKGLVGGFTENIKKEQEARGMDDQRLAAIEDTMIQASLDPKKRVPESLATMVRDAKAGLKKRGGIDIFGRAGPRLELDINKISGLMNEVDDEKSFYDLGKYKIPIASDFYEPKTKGIFKANTFFQTFQDYIKANPDKTVEIVDYLNSDEGSLYKQAFNNDFSKFGGYWNKANLIKQTSIDGNTTILNKADFEGSFGLFLNAFKNVITNQRSQSDIEIDSYINKFDEKEDGSKGAIPKNSFVFYNNEGNIGLFTFKDVEKYSALDMIARENGFDMKNNVSKFIEAYRKSVQKDRPTISFTEDGKVRFDMSTRKQQLQTYLPNLFYAIDLRQLGANKDSANLDDEEKLKILQYAGKKALTRGQIIQSIAPLMQPDENNKSFFGSMIGYESTTSSVDKEKLFKEYVGMNIKDFTDGYNATRDTVKKINELLVVISKTSATGAITEELTKFFANVTFPVGGTIKQLAQMIASGDPKRGDTSVKDLEDIITRVKGEGYSIYGDALNIGLQDSMVIYLAAAMARAVDPSGRLSNQDFEVQMRRLGVSGLFTSKPMKVTMLRDVADDFNEKFERIEIINDILKDSTGKGLNKRQLQLLMANEKLNGLLDAVTGAEIGKPKKRNLNEMHKGRRRYVPELENGKPTGRYIDRKENFAKIQGSEFK
jgi:hypothetical protein